MKSQTFQPESQALSKNDLLIRKAVLVYSDTEAGLRAKQRLEHLPGHMKITARSEIKFWRHDLLSLPWLREQAAVDGSDASLIIISVDAPGETPGEVADWMKRWLEHKGTSACAVILLVPASCLGKHGQHPTANFARRIAEKANAMFFCLIEAAGRAPVEEPQDYHDRDFRAHSRPAAARTHALNFAAATAPSIARTSSGSRSPRGS